LAVEGVLLAMALTSLLHRRKQARKAALLEARHDSLTRLNNRRAFYELAVSPWNNARRHMHPTSLLILDLDFFKVINDQHGHPAGDAVLRDVAALLSHSCRAGDVATRWGGEEFVILLPETKAAEALLFAQRLHSAIAKVPIAVLDGSGITTSIGVATRTREEEIDELIARADEALYRAKAAGRDCVMVAEVDATAAA